jgi:hypothetical protein
MRVKAMRNLVLAVGGVLLITAGIVLAAFMAVTPAQTRSDIGPAVVVGSATPAGGGTATQAPSATPSPSRPSRSGATATPTRPPASPAGSTGSAGEDHVHSVAPSPAVQVTDDHGGGRRSGRHGD